MGRGTYGNPRVLIWGEDERICIGAFCSISDEVAIFGGGEHRMDWITTYPLRIAYSDEFANRDGHPATKGHTRIGSDVWIGFRAMIMSGVSIGDGAVIGAGAVVARDVPPYAVVVGNPARVLRYRFSAEQIRCLLRIKWWLWDDDKIKDSTRQLCSSNVEGFIESCLGPSWRKP